MEVESEYPDVWLDEPDKFESRGVNWNLEIIPIDRVTEVAWTVHKDRKTIEKAFLNNEKLPLILVEKLDGSYELHDGQHRFAAYKNVFPDVQHIKVAVFTRLR